MCSVGIVFLFCGILCFQGAMCLTDFGFKMLGKKVKSRRKRKHRRRKHVAAHVKGIDALVFLGLWLIIVLCVCFYCNIGNARNS